MFNITQVTQKRPVHPVRSFSPPHFMGAASAMGQDSYVSSGTSSAEPPAPTPEMKHFITLEGQAGYDEQERKHGGWVLANGIQRALLLDPFDVPEFSETGASPRILEIGCSSGTSTIPMIQKLLAIPDGMEHYDAIDIDTTAIGMLNRLLAKTQAAPGSSKVSAFVADAMRLEPGEGNEYSHALMQFSLSHFDDPGKRYLLDRFSKIMHLSYYLEKPEWSRTREAWQEWLSSRPYRLKPEDPVVKKGTLIVTDEFLPEYRDAATEAEALWTHHGAVIYDALIKGNRELAELELEAMYSGLHKIGDFKISGAEFEDMLWEKGLAWKKFKTFPLIHADTPDLVPYPENTSLFPENSPEAKANRLWRQHSREIFKTALAMTPGADAMKLPDPPKELLRKLADRFHEAGLDTLRENLDPDTLELTPEVLARCEVAKAAEPEKDAWGVYTYQISLDIHNRQHSGGQQYISHFIHPWESVEENGERLYKWLGSFDAIENELASVLPLPPERWRAAFRQPRPSFQELQDPDVYHAWAKKVNFSKDVIRYYLRREGALAPCKPS